MLGWVCLGWQPDAPQLPLIAAPQQVRGENRMRKEIKRGRLLTSYSHRQHRLNLRKVNLFQLERTWIVKNRKQTLKQHLLPPLPLSSQARFQLFVSDSSLLWQGLLQRPQWYLLQHHGAPSPPPPLILPDVSHFHFIFLLSCLSGVFCLSQHHTCG